MFLPNAFGKESKTSITPIKVHQSNCRMDKIDMNYIEKMLWEMPRLEGARPDLARDHLWSTPLK